MNWFSQDFNFFHHRYWFGELDSRPLSLFRIFFAGWLLKDAFYHVMIADTFYSETGVVPLSALRDGLARSTRFSLMDALPQTWMAQIFFGLWIAILIALMLGYHTRLMTILNFIVILSIHERNIYILNGADTMMRVVSFWMMFITLGQHYSLDALRTPPRTRTAFAFPVRMLQIQVALVYLFTFILKLPGDIWLHGEALHYALQLQSLTLPTGDWFFQHAPMWILQLMDYMTLFTEGAFFILVFVPIFQPYLRGLGLFLGAMMHIGIAVLMSIDNFSFVMMITYLVFLPAGWIQVLEKRIFVITQPISHKIKKWIPAREQPSGMFLPPDAIIPLHRTAKMILSLGLGFMMGLVLWWNIDSARDRTVNHLPPTPRALVQYIGLWQHWGMFAPYPILADGWISIPGQFENGVTLDLMTGKPPTDSFLRWLAGPDMRWKKYIETVQLEGQTPLLNAWGGYYCRKYNIERESPPLTTLEIHFIWRHSYPPGGIPQSYQTRILWQHWCYPEYEP